MKRLLVLMITLLSIGSCYSQFRHRYDFSLAWHEGTAILFTGDTVSCTLRYNQTLSVGALQILQGEDVLTLSSKEVQEFSFYDNEKNRWRKFSSIMIEEEEPVNQKLFVEHLYYNKQFSIVNLKTIDVPFDYMNYTRLISKPVRMSKKYILDSKTGALLPLSKGNALKLMDPKRDQIASFIHEHRLRFKNVADYIDVLEYHSSL
jgi:hypothetical protein